MRAEDEAEPRLEPWLAEAVATLREPVALGPGYLERALASLPATAPARRYRFLVALPLGAAAVLAVAVGLGQRDAVREGRLPVEFSVAVPGSRVTLVGDFNDWNPAANRLERRGRTWNVTLRLPPGRYRYAYLVDGERWLPDPSLPAAPDDFGTPTSVITIAR